MSIDPVSAVMDGIAKRGYAVVPDAVSEATVAALRETASAADAGGHMQPARVGHTRSEGVRGDRIRWLDERPGNAAECETHAWLETLRTACNHDLLLGLSDFEGHYALYAPGASYARHRDRFRDDDRRVLSFVLYLNATWQPADGGSLRLYVDDATNVDVVPRGGTIVAFLSADFEHEVLPATRPRWSLAGWFRRRAQG